MFITKVYLYVYKRQFFAHFSSKSSKALKFASNLHIISFSHNYVDISGRVQAELRIRVDFIRIRPSRNEPGSRSRSYLIFS